MLGARLSRFLGDMGTARKDNQLKLQCLKQKFIAVSTELRLGSELGYCALSSATDKNEMLWTRLIVAYLGFDG